MMQQAIIKCLMRLRESEIKFDFEEGAVFKELFDHPRYLSLDETAQTELGLRWANKLYQKETECSSINSYFENMDLSKYFKDAIMLDIGCYLGGKTIRWLEGFQGAEIHGIDIDSRFIKVATLFTKEKKANAHFKVSFAEELDFPDEYFDVILSENTFEHVTDLQKVMSECCRVLKNKGFMVVIFPSFWGPFSHHLDLVTRTPFIHWFFKYPSLLGAYFSILDERGEDAFWYTRKDRHPLPFERGYSINGTAAREFSTLLKGDWDIIIDGFKQRVRNQGRVKNTLMNCIKAFPFFRDLLPIAYLLQKR